MSVSINNAPEGTHFHNMARDGAFYFIHKCKTHMEVEVNGSHIQYVWDGSFCNGQMLQ